MSQRPRKRSPGGGRVHSSQPAEELQSAPPQSSLDVQGDGIGSSRPGRSPDMGPDSSTAGDWPSWGIAPATCLLLFHMAAVVSGALGVPPSSLLERTVADFFTPYHDLLDQGYAYRYYAEPPPTPVITARLRFADGRPERTIRIPDRSLSGPRMRHQRQLALANSLFSEFQQTRQPGAPDRMSRLGAAYARKLCAEFPGGEGVTLHAQQHLIPDPEHVREHREASRNRAFDLFDESLFTTPQRIGDYSCDGS